MPAPEHANERHLDLLSTRFHPNSSRKGVTPFTEPSFMTPGDAEIMVQLREDDTIGGYRLMELIGHGGMGLVFRCEHLALSRICALKCLAPSMVSRTSWEMFKNEARIAGGLKHPAICQIYDLGLHGNKVPFYAMEFLPGETLHEVLEHQGPLSVGAVAEIFLNIAEGLAYAHNQGIVHKDIKPANIMIETNGEGDLSVKLLDFGIAELVLQENEEDHQKPRVVVGTAFYMSPEQFTGEALDWRSDIYSVGCSMFEALTGQPPYSGSSREELSAHHAVSPVPTLSKTTGTSFPLEVEAIVKKALAKEPDKRYRYAEELAQDLQNVLDDKPLQFAVEEWNELNQARKEPVRKVSTKKLMAITVVSLVLISLVLVVSVFSSNQKPKENPTALKLRHSKKSTAASKVPVVSAKKPMSGSQIKAVNLALSQAFAGQRYQDVLTYTQQLIDNGAANGNVYLTRGAALSALERSEEALPDLQKALKMTPSLKTDYISDLLVKCYYDLGQLDNALKEQSETLRTKPNAFRFRQKGQILCELKRPEEAIACFDEAIRLAPREYWTRLDRGKCYANLNRHEQAVKDFTRCIELLPSQRRSYEARARSYQSLGKSDLAAADLLKARQLGQSDFNQLEPANSIKKLEDLP